MCFSVMVAVPSQDRNENNLAKLPGRHEEGEIMPAYGTVTTPPMHALSDHLQFEEAGAH